MKYNIEQRLKDAGLTWQALADATGSSLGKLYYSINTAKNPSIEVLEAVAGALGCKVADLLDEGDAGAEEMKGVGNPEEDATPITATVFHDGQPHNPETVGELYQLLQRIREDNNTPDANPCYLTGRLIAVLERNRGEAFSAVAMGNIMRAPAGHIATYTKPADYDDDARAILEAIGEVPKTMVADGQGKAWVGYYHQKNRNNG